MTNNTKQSEETHIEWRIMGNPVLSGEATPETILTIHPDGRVTTSPRLKPTEAAALVLDQIKTQWMIDSQATTIRELQERIKRLEEFARTIENDFDHDEDAHRYGTTCRVCDAEDLLKETKAKEAKL